MKNILKSMILPIFLGVIIIVSLIDYMKYGEIEFSQLCIIFALMPMAIEGVKPNQYGTWGYGRAGWCPGMDVAPYIIDITNQIEIGDDNIIILSSIYSLYLIS